MRSLLLLLPASLLTPSVSAQEASLERVEPTPGVDENDPVRSLFGRAFDPGAWRDFLAEPDLDRRMEHFERLVLRARLDPAARVFVEDLARDGSTELAWTARLAERELGRAQPGGWLALGAAAELYRSQFAELFQAIAGDRPEIGFQLPPVRGAAGVRDAVDLLREVHLSQGPDGARVRVSERAADEVRAGRALEGTGRMRPGDPSWPEPAERVLEGETLARIFADHPELAEVVRLDPAALPGRFEITLTLPHTLPGRGDVDAAPWLPADGRGRPDTLSPTGLVAVRTDVLGVHARPASRVERALVREKTDLEAGLRVTKLEPGTIADQLGVRTGDLLVRLNGRLLWVPDDITLQMEARRRMEPVTLLWIDDLGMPIRGSWTPAPEPEPND